MVWFAPVWRSSGGRSAVSTSRGVRDWSASTTAGWKLAAAVPEVHTTAAGRPVALAAPRAQKAADRSSISTCVLRPGCPASASARGVEREPGATNASVRPHRSSSSTSTVARACPALRIFMPCRTPPPAIGPPGAPEGLHLQHDEVGRLAEAQVEGILRQAHELVGGERHVDEPAEPGHVPGAAHGLLHVLQAERSEAPDLPGRLVEVPRAVDVQ